MDVNMLNQTIIHSTPLYVKVKLDVVTPKTVIIQWYCNDNYYR